MGLNPTDIRGVSEGTGVAVLVVMTVVATASVGMTVTLVMDEDDGPFGAEFTFDHAEGIDQLLIFYDSGDELRAGSIHIIGETNEVTWAEIEDMEPDAMVAPSNIPARLTSDNAWGTSVSEDDFVEIRYVPDDDDDDAEEVVLATWNEPDDEQDDAPIDVPEG